MEFILGINGWFNIWNSIKFQTHKQPKKIKIYMIISVDAEEVLDSIQHWFMIETLSKLGLKGNFLSLTVNISKKPTADIILWIYIVINSKPSHQYQVQDKKKSPLSFIF